MFLREDSFRLVQSEAESRGISIQQLIRAVIIPEWMKVNGMESAKTLSTPTPTYLGRLDPLRATSWARKESIAPAVVPPAKVAETPKLVQLVSKQQS